MGTNKAVGIGLIAVVVMMMIVPAASAASQTFWVSENFQSYPWQESLLGATVCVDTNCGITDENGEVTLTGLSDGVAYTAKASKSGFECSRTYCNRCSATNTVCERDFICCGGTKFFGLQQIGGQVCTPDATRCYDDDLEQCSADGMAWVFVQTCDYGCSAGACNPAPTPTPTPSPTPDPCDGVTCENYCFGDTLYYNGYCYYGTCQYSSMSCAYGCSGGSCNPAPTQTPTPTPTATPTWTPTPTPTPDPGTCTPNEERCFGDYLKTCNLAGDGWDDGKTELCTWGCDAEKGECAQLLPGFEAVFALLGLLTVGYFVRRGRKEE